MATSSAPHAFPLADSLDRKTVLTLVAGAALGTLAWPALRALVAAVRQAACDASSLEERSTTSSAGGGAAAYETRKAVDEYVQFHFAADGDLLPYAAGPKVCTVHCPPLSLEQAVGAGQAWGSGARAPSSDAAPPTTTHAKGLHTHTQRAQAALNFTGRLAQLCKRFAPRSSGSALDMGCAVGGASFELARHYEHVLGVDYSHAFVAAAQVHACAARGTAIRLTWGATDHVVLLPPCAAPLCRTCSKRARASTRRWWRATSGKPSRRRCPRIYTASASRSSRCARRNRFATSEQHRQPSCFARAKRAGRVPVHAGGRVRHPRRAAPRAV